MLLGLTVLILDRFDVVAMGYRTNYFRSESRSLPAERPKGSRIEEIFNIELLDSGYLRPLFNLRLCVHYFMQLHRLL
jgi:hypothetical protein